MKCLFFRDVSSRKNLLNKEATKLSLKILFFDTRLAIAFRIKVGALYQRLYNANGLNGFNNRCCLTKRNSSVIRNFRLSRIAFRNKVLFGQLLGVLKKSW